MSETITVYKLDEHGNELWQYPAQVLAKSDSHVRLEAFFNRDDMDLGFTTFKRGDRFIEYFYTNRWYNVFAVYDRDDGTLKGWYCNVCRPSELTQTAVYCEDLALDVWVAPHGATTILDEDEFAALEITKEERKNGRAALRTILQLAARQQLPK